MKRLSLYLFLILFTLPTPSQADDIRGLEIEGMSIGDSALDYFSEEEIKNGERYDYPKSKKFTDIEIIKLPQFKEYYSIHINFKTNDKNYKIYALDGTILFQENIKDCYKKKDEIVEDVSEILTGAKKRDRGTIKHAYDKSGKSTYTDFYFEFQSGKVKVSCYDWSKEMKYSDHLRISINSKEFDNFINNEAY